MSSRTLLEVEACTDGNCVVEWKEVAKTPISKGVCDPNPNPEWQQQPGWTKICPLPGTVVLPPRGSLESSAPVLSAGSLACVAPADGTQCNARSKTFDGTPEYTRLRGRL